MAYPLSNAPNSRETFKSYCLRKLGDGVMNVEISDEQVDDCIDDALRFFWDYHFEGTEKTYYKYAVTTTDIANKYITLPANIIGAVNLFDFTSSARQDNIFNIRYQIAINDLYTLTSIDMTPYFMTMQHLQFLEYLLIGRQPIRYNRHNNIFYMDMDWNRLAPGDFVIVEAYQVLDPDVYNDTWQDRWLLKYAVALMKKQQGVHLKKYIGAQMPGGVQFNGQRIYDEAVMEIEDIEKEVIRSYSLPVSDMIG